jgi:hypothetical protein
MQNARYTFLFAILLFAQTVSFGQSRQRWSFGPRAGLNLTNFVGSDANPDVSKLPGTYNELLPGLSAGVGFVYSDISRFGFGVDVLYSQRGNKFKVTDQNVEYSSINRINYLELPITGRYYLTRGGNFRPNIYLGAVPALRLNGKSITKGGTVDTSVDRTDFYKPADLGLTGGIQLNWGTGDRQHFTVDLRYTHGITNISVFNSDLRNQMITVGLGYYFGIGRQYRPGDRKLPIRTR